MVNEVKIYPCGKANQTKAFVHVPEYMKTILGNTSTQTLLSGQDGSVVSPQTLHHSPKLERAFVFGVAKNKDEHYLPFAKKIMKCSLKKHTNTKRETPLNFTTTSRGGR
ncbi:MAG: hypothetical protein ACK5N8_08865 [Alphaproteobacteria bacterium]